MVPLVRVAWRDSLVASLVWLLQPYAYSAISPRNIHTASGPRSLTRSTPIHCALSLRVMTSLPSQWLVHRVFDCLPLRHNAARPWTDWKGKRKQLGPDGLTGQRILQQLLWPCLFSLRLRWPCPSLGECQQNQVTIFASPFFCFSIGVQF